VPVFMPALVTAIAAVMLSREDSAPLAYIAGSLGTHAGTPNAGILRYFRKSRFAWECVVGLRGLEPPTKRL
jgi:uncharacterized membrane protein